MELGIPHGGWAPKGRKTEAGPLPEKYQLREMPTESYPGLTDKNVLDSDGTLILSHGRLTGGSALTDRLAAKYGRPFLHVDLNKVNDFGAAETIADWITEHGISVLNVAGPRASKDPEIYDSVKRVLTTVLNVDHIRTDMPELERTHRHLPRTVDEAVEYLMSDLDLKDKTKIAKMAEDELIYLHPTLGQYVRNRFELWAENKILMQSCRLAVTEAL